MSAKQDLSRVCRWGNRRVGAVLSLAAIATWPLLHQWGAVTMQTVHSIGRLWFWLAMLLWFGLLSATTPALRGHYRAVAERRSFEQLPG
ncbi:MAG: hypothetical protein JSW43_11455 [Gemmatimonadota bacterium]|nr:MAG: hypothetical protein JSW43_11455 [Gemmatimonadota bacterium]